MEIVKIYQKNLAKVEAQEKEYIELRKTGMGGDEARQQLGLI